MKQVEHWRWIVNSETPPGRRIKTSYRMTREEALKRDPTAEPIPGTMILRDSAETEEESWALRQQRKPSPIRPDGTKG